MGIFCYNQLGFARGSKEIELVRFAARPFVSDKVNPKLGSVKWKLACGIGMTGLYFITRADNPNDLFDIYPAAVFKQKIIRRSDRVIIGVAESMSGATDLIVKMVDEWRKKDDSLSDIGTFIDEYFKDER